MALWFIIGLANGKYLLVELDAADETLTPEVLLPLTTEAPPEVHLTTEAPPGNTREYTLTCIFS